MSQLIATIESRDAKRMRTIHYRQGDPLPYDANGMRIDPLTGNATVAGHNQFASLDAAKEFVRSICGLTQARAEA